MPGGEGGCYLKDGAVHILLQCTRDLRERLLLLELPTGTLELTIPYAGMWLNDTI